MLEYLLFVREDEDGLFIRLPADVASRLDTRPGERVELTEVESGFVLSAVPKPDPEEESRNARVRKDSRAVRWSLATAS